MKKSLLIRFNSIWKKYVFIIGALSIFSLLVSALFTVRMETLSINREMNTDLNILLAESALSFTDPLWEYNYNNLNLLSAVIINRENVYAIQITDKTRGVIIDAKNTLYAVAPSEVKYGEKPLLKNGREIGRVRIGIATSPYMTDLYRQLWARLVQSLLEISAFTTILLWVSFSITRPLKALEKTITAFANGEYSSLAEIQGEDEIAHVATAFNVMARRIEEADFELRALNASLEQLVLDRTQELQITNEELQAALAKSQQVQNELAANNEVLNETMRALENANRKIVETTKSNLTSQLIAGVAHEINTPVGVMVTTNTYLIREVELLRRQIETGVLNASDLMNFLDTLSEATLNFERNLSNTHRLISNFKEVAVDQTSQRARSFELKAYLEEIISTLRPAFKRRPITVSLDCPEGIELNSYPGVYSQVFTNLIMNSMKHAFKADEPGIIRIQVELQDDWLHILYSDNGCGVTPEVLEQLFTPFFSTEHNQGGSGLGLSIVKHMIEKTLQGEIQCSSTPMQGIQFHIRVPVMRNLEATL